MKRWLLLVAMLACAAANAQNGIDGTVVSTTGNLVTFDPNGSATTTPWTPVGQWGGQLTCWAPGQAGNCGPYPSVNANGYGMINFSYGYTNLHQVVGIADALPSSGSGLVVNGFTFGFTAKNGNGWDGGRQDYLVAYAAFFGSSGTLKEYYDYASSTNRKYDWTNFYFNETFTTPYAAKDLSVAQYGFAGYDTNGWAGPYGPEIRNVSFSLKYSVDPCAKDPMSSPTCPGYLDALAKLVPDTSPTTSPTTTTTTASTTPTTTTTTTAPVAVVSEPVATTTATSSSSSTTNTAANPTVVAVQPVQPAVQPIVALNPTTPTSANNQPTGVSASTLSSAMNSIKANQQRDQAIAATAVANAIAEAQTATANTEKLAMTVAATAASNSMTTSQQNSGQTNNQSATNSFSQFGFSLQTQSSQQTMSNQSAPSALSQNTGGQKNTIEVAMLQPPTSTTTTSTSTFNQPQQMQPPVNNSRVITTSPQQNNVEVFQMPEPPIPQFTPTTPTVMNTPVFIQPPIMRPPEQPIIQKEYKAPEIVVPTIPTPNLMDRNNILAAMIEQKPIYETSSAALEQKFAVNQNAQPNEAAGNVNIASIALQPVGYESYTNLVLKDAAFYAPKEVYKNQKTVDNARALRQLSNDSKHREMIELQYTRGEK